MTLQRTITREGVAMSLSVGVRFHSRCVAVFFKRRMFTYG